MSKLSYLRLILKRKSLVILFTLLVLIIIISSCGKTKLEKSPRLNIQELDEFNQPSGEELFVQMDIFDSFHKTLYILNNGEVILYGEFPKKSESGHEIKALQIMIEENELNALKKKIIEDHDFFSLRRLYENDQIPTDIVRAQIIVYKNEEGNKKSHTSNCTIAFCDEQRFENIVMLILDIWPEEIEIVGQA